LCPRPLIGAHKVDITKVFSTDSELERKGVWVEIGAKGETVRVARMYNPEYSAALRGSMQPYKRKVSGGRSNEDSLEIMIAVEAETILLDWRGFTESGEEVKYSVEKAKQYLRLKDFRMLILEIAGNMETFKAQEVEENEKNS